MGHSVLRFLWATCPETCGSLSFVTRLDTGCSGLLLAGAGLLGGLLQGLLMLEYRIMRCYVVAGAGEVTGVSGQSPQMIRRRHSK
mmetsp:Transcript_91989/g.260394  ORF Transcript_91989/g.260394 Transcript_91989/m.260394 type:complete len:85 (+) Transcript_91989:1797-2051(+)